MRGCGAEGWPHEGRVHFSDTSSHPVRYLKSKQQPTRPPVFGIQYILDKLVLNESTVDTTLLFRVIDRLVRYQRRSQRFHAISFFLAPRC